MKNITKLSILSLALSAIATISTPTFAQTGMNPGGMNPGGNQPRARGGIRQVRTAAMPGDQKPANTPEFDKSKGTSGSGTFEARLPNGEKIDMSKPVAGQPTTGLQDLTEMSKRQQQQRK